MSLEEGPAGSCARPLHARAIAAPAAAHMEPPPAPPLLRSAQAFLNTFSWEVWMAIALTALAVSFIM